MQLPWKSGLLSRTRWYLYDEKGAKSKVIIFFPWTEEPSPYLAPSLQQGTRMIRWRGPFVRRPVRPHSYHPHPCFPAGAETLSPRTADITHQVFVRVSELSDQLTKALGGAYRREKRVGATSFRGGNT